MDDQGAIQYSAAWQTHIHGVHWLERRDVAYRERAGKEVGRVGEGGGTTEGVDGGSLGGEEGREQGEGGRAGGRERVGRERGSNDATQARSVSGGREG